MINPEKPPIPSPRLVSMSCDRSQNSVTNFIVCFSLQVVARFRICISGSKVSEQSVCTLRICNSESFVIREICITCSSVGRVPCCKAFNAQASFQGLFLKAPGVFASTPWAETDSHHFLASVKCNLSSSLACD